MGDYLPLSGGTVTGEIIFTNINPFSFGPGDHTVEVDNFDISNGNVVSNYSSLNFRLASSQESTLTIGTADNNIFSVSGDGSVSLSTIDTPLSVPSLTSSGSITVNNQVISATDAEMIIQGEGVDELGPIQSPNPQEDFPSGYLELVQENNFGRDQRAIIFKVNNDIYSIDVDSVNKTSNCKKI